MANGNETSVIAREGWGGEVSQGFGGVIFREGFGGGRPEHWGGGKSLGTGTQFIEGCNG